MERAVGNVRRTDLGQRRFHLTALQPCAKLDEAAHGQGHCTLDMNALRHITDRQAAPAPDGSAVGPNQPQHRTHKCGLPRPVRSDQSHDPARIDGNIDTIKNQPVAQS